MAQYYSQYGQDRLLNSIFGGKAGGIFLDIGAHDGVDLSNSYFFEKEKNWTGICVEPLPEVFKKLEKNRNCIVENCAISDVEGDLDFVAASGDHEMISGFGREQVVIEHIKESGGSYEIIKVPTFRLDTILDKHGIVKADFCSLDVETHEINVVKSLDWENYYIKFLVIEANIGIEVVERYLSPWYEMYGRIVGDIILKRK